MSQFQRFLLLTLTLIGYQIAFGVSITPSATCKIFPGKTVGVGSIRMLENVPHASTCCDICTADSHCMAWTWHAPPTSTCWLKDNTEDSGRPIDKKNHTCSGLRDGPLPSAFACVPPLNKWPFCNLTLSVDTRVSDLISRINDTVKANLLTARGRGGDGKHMQALPDLGVPVYYWGTNCLHSLNSGSCVVDSKNVSRCPVNFPSGPSFGATFDRSLIQRMASAIGVELRAMFWLKKNPNSIDCWGPVINLNRDPRWGRNGEGGLEDAYAMGELAKAWVRGFQSPRPSLLDPSRTLLQGIVTLKHMAVNSLENTAPFNRHNFDGNATFGVNPFVLADYYLRPFEAAIRGGARGIMCSYNSVLGVPTCLSKLLHAARSQWGFEGYVTSDSDSIHDAYGQHHYVKTGAEATALALTNGQCDINSGDTYNNNLLKAVHGSVDDLKMSDVDRALFNSFKQRFDLGLFDPPDAYAWPSADDVGTDASLQLSLQASQESIVLLRNDQHLLPLPAGKAIAVIGPHASAQKVMVQPYPFTPYCPDHSLDCIKSPFSAIAAINNAAGGSTKMAQGCDLFKNSQKGFKEALDLANASDYVILGLGIETCGMDPSHNVNPKRPGKCYQEGYTTNYVYPDAYLELEAHDRTIIDLPEIQHSLAAAVLKLGKPTIIFLMNAGAVSIDAEASYSGSNPIAIIEAFYPGPKGGQALAEGIFGKHNRWGRLPYTIYPASFIDEAEMSMHDLRVAPGRTYRYYRNPTYSFGHGLSLTEWTLSANSPICLTTLTTDSSKSCSVQLLLTNTGKRDGDSVIMVYFNASTSPHKEGMLLSPLKQLIDFQRHSINADSSSTLTFNITARSFASVEPSGDLVAVAGQYNLIFEDGGDNQVILQGVLTGSRHVIEPFPKSA